MAGCDGQLHIVDLTNGQSLGKVDIQAPTGVTPAVAGDHVFFGTEGSVFFCVDWKRAAVVWTFEDEQRQQPMRSAPAVPAARSSSAVGPRRSIAWTPRTGTCCGSSRRGSVSMRRR